MSESNLLLSKIQEINSKIEVDKIKRILVVYDLNSFAIGDTCVSIARFRKSAQIYKSACLDINTVNKKHYELISNITKNNPYINNYFNLQWDQIDFSKYDLVICGCVPELKFLEFLLLNYSERILSDGMATAFFSVSGNVGFDEERYGTPVFPINHVFNNFKLSDNDYALMSANELFIDDSEIEWSERWLVKNGLSIKDNLFIFLDSSNGRDKLLNISHYFDLIAWILGFPGVKVLIFDEMNLGKRSFYTQWLGPKLSANLIFAESMSLRDAICLIASPHTKLMFGPSTGLLHCASGIFNVLLQKNYSMQSVPVLIGYIGKCEGGYKEEQWWGHSLVNIIVPLQRGNSKELCFLRTLDFEQVSMSKQLLSAQEITSEMLIDFIKTKYSERLEKLGLNSFNN
jgi:hypothetical protein